ncbi:MAG: carboxypeptidase-like regulatory domain-containing protein [Bacteroidota bacterium]
MCHIKKNCRILMLGAILCFWATATFAQSTYLTISGTVVNQKNEEPIPYASIAITGRSIGTTSNTQGNFVFKVPSAYLQDSLRVSCVGFQSFTQAIATLPKQAIIIRLQPATLLLEEVQVQAQAKSAIDILKEAIAAIPLNYDTASAQLTAFYREAARFEGQPVSFIESVLSVYKSPHNRPETKDGLKIIKGRKKQFDRSKHRLPEFVNLSNGARSSLFSDIPKYYAEKNSILNEKNFKYYDFRLSRLMEDRLTYVIDIIPKKNKPKAYASGKLYIDAQTLAFTQAEFQATQAGLDLDNNRNWFLKKLASMIQKMDFELSGYRVVTTYAAYQNKWYMNNVERDIEGIINSRSRNLKNSRWQVSSSFTVTEVGPKNIPPFTEGNISENENSMISLIGDQYDANFWENYNIQQPTAADTIFEKKTPVQTAPKSGSFTPKPSNRINGFTRGDTLRGKLSPLRSSYDVSFYHLNVKVDPAQQFISGSNTIRFRVVAAMQQMQIDLYANMAIHQILYQGQPLAYSREYDAVFIQLPQLLQPGTQQEIEINYSGKPQVPDFSVPMMGGFLWDKDQEGNPWVQVVCQGSGASLWWPNKDHLSDEPDSMRISVTVPSHLTEISNGRLLGKTPLPDHWTRYDWFVSYPINNYNVTLNIGKYAHLRDTYLSSDTITLDYYYMPYQLEKARQVWKGVKPMLACLEKQYGPYPFPRDGFTLMESLYPMEHQSAVSFGKLPTAEMDTLQLMKLVWHEVSHEWWGNNVSCQDLADMWIHEAFATYSEGFYMQSAFGKYGEAGYQASLLSQVSGKEPILGVYDVNHIHYEIGDMYAKACLMLYTFRHVLHNDTLWSAILRGIQQDFRYKTVTTQDIVRYINTKTRTDYSYFFDQYLKHPSIPTLVIHTTETAQSLVVKYKWIADVTNFRMPIRVTKAKNKFDFIHPTTTWQTKTFPRMTADDFEVDEAQFYVKVIED